MGDPVTCFFKKTMPENSKKMIKKGIKKNNRQSEFKKDAKKNQVGIIKKELADIHKMMKPLIRFCSKKIH